MERGGGGGGGGGRGEKRGKERNEEGEVGEAGGTVVCTTTLLSECGVCLVVGESLRRKPHVTITISFFLLPATLHMSLLRLLPFPFTAPVPHP